MIANRFLIAALIGVAAEAKNHVTYKFTPKDSKKVCGYDVSKIVDMNSFKAFDGFINSSLTCTDNVVGSLTLTNSDLSSLWTDTSSSFTLENVWSTSLNLTTIELNIAVTAPQLSVTVDGKLIDSAKWMPSSTSTKTTLKFDNGAIQKNDNKPIVIGLGNGVKPTTMTFAESSYAYSVLLNKSSSGASNAIMLTSALLLTIASMALF